MNVILLTTCPGGSVTSYLAAQRLTPAAEAKDWQLSTEVHSSLAPVETLSHQTLKLRSDIRYHPPFAHNKIMTLPRDSTARP